MKIIGNIIVTIASLAVVAICIGGLWFLKWSDNYVNNMTVLDEAEVYYHVGVCGEDSRWFIINKFGDHVLETIGLD